MALKLIPAIDLIDGECVRLIEGNLQTKKVYSKNPCRTAVNFQEQGADSLHLVDLDGAFTGKMKNLATIKQIIDSVSIPVQVGGGIRTVENVDKLVNSGVQHIVLGTKAHNDPAFLEKVIAKYPDKIAVGVDFRANKVATEGWRKLSETETGEYIAQLHSRGVQRIILTDITKDGKLQGPNLELLQNLALFDKINFIMSGGISTLEDIKILQEFQQRRGSNLEGVILGKALYEQKLKLGDAVQQIKRSK